MGITDSGVARISREKATYPVTQRT